MPIRYNPRLSLKRTHFHALSCVQLCDYLKSLNYSSAKREDKTKIENAWWDIHDSLYNGMFFRWLESQVFNSEKLGKISNLLNKYDLIWLMLKKLVEILFDTKSLPQNIADFLDAQIKKERSCKTYDNPEVGKNWVMKLSDTPEITLEMVWVDVNEKDEKDGKIKPYIFNMGSEDVDSFGDEKPHKVKLTQGYWIAKYPVTQEQWNVISVDLKSPSYFQGNNYPKESESNKNPVESVTWEEASAFSAKINNIFSSKLKRINVTQNRKRFIYEFDLPTEAQWEFAARGGVQSKGYKYSGSNDINEVAWYYENSGELYLDDDQWDITKVYVLKENDKSEFEKVLNEFRTYPVGMKMPNELGIHDMNGNVCEWCKDCCEWDDKKKVVKTNTYKSVITDPYCKVGSRRIFRGGSWGGTARYCRPTCRNGEPPTKRFCYVGFRLALVPVLDGVRLP